MSQKLNKYSTQWNDILVLFGQTETSKTSSSDLESSSSLPKVDSSSLSHSLSYFSSRRKGQYCWFAEHPSNSLAVHYVNALVNTSPTINKKAPILHSFDNLTERKKICGREKSPSSAKCTNTGKFFETFFNFSSLYVC